MPSPEPNKPAPASQSGDKPAANPAKAPENIVELEGAAKIKAIVASFPPDTPDSHVMFGYGGHKVTVGDLKKV